MIVLTGFEGSVLSLLAELSLCSQKDILGIETQDNLLRTLKGDAFKIATILVTGESPTDCGNGVCHPTTCSSTTCHISMTAKNILDWAKKMNGYHEERISYV